MAKEVDKPIEMSFEDCVKEVLKNNGLKFGEKIEKILYSAENPCLKKLCKIAELIFLKFKKTGNCWVHLSEKHDLDFFVETVRKLIKIENIDFEKLHLITQYDSICNDFFVYLVLKNHGLKENCNYLDESERMKFIISGLFLEHSAIINLNFKEFLSTEKLLNYGYAIDKYEKLKEKRLKDKNKSVEQ